MNLICQRESELPPLCVQMGCTLPPFNPISFPSNLFSLLPFSLSMNTSFYIRFQQDDQEQQSFEGKKCFSVTSCFCFSAVGPAGPPGQIHLWLYGLHNISRKQNNHQTKHNPLLKLDLEQLRSSQIGKKGNADI